MANGVLGMFSMGIVCWEFLGQGAIKEHIEVDDYDLFCRLKEHRTLWMFMDTRNPWYISLQMDFYCSIPY